MKTLFVTAVLGLACAGRQSPGPAPEPSQEKSVQVDSATQVSTIPELGDDAGLQERSFFYVWDRIRETYPYEDMKGVDWTGAYLERLEDARAAESAEELRPVIDALLAELGESHFMVHPADRQAVMESDASDSESEGPRDLSADLDLDVRLVGDQCLVVRLGGDSAAEQAGVSLGDQILSIGEVAIEDLIADLDEEETDPSMRLFFIRRKVLTEMKGPPGSEVPLRWRTPTGEVKQASIARAQRTGQMVQFGNLPSLEVSFDHGIIETPSGSRIGKISFNIFLGDVVSRFSSAMESFVEQGVDGVIVDLRGNPGGLGAMSRGMAGHFLFDASQSLGRMKTRQMDLNFFVVPRAPAQRFEGPLAVLVDGHTGSTSEILAGGLQDLGRAAIVGSTSAGMALPSVIERMPNGDAIQFAMGDLVTSSGYRIEGQGILPDIEVELSPESLARGGDPVVQAAMDWIESRHNQSMEQK